MRVSRRNGLSGPSAENGSSSRIRKLECRECIRPPSPGEADVFWRAPVGYSHRRNKWNVNSETVKMAPNHPCSLFYRSRSAVGVYRLPLPHHIVVLTNSPRLDALVGCMRWLTPRRRGRPRLRFVPVMPPPPLSHTSGSSALPPALMYCIPPPSLRGRTPCHAPEIARCCVH